MKTEQNIRLTSAELASLWSTYLADSMSICVFQYFLCKVKDTQTEAMIKYALQLAQKHTQIIEMVFNDEGIPIPRGFTEHDVNMDAPSLFQDTFFLIYIKHMTKGGLSTYGTILPNVVREDIREFFSGCLASTTNIYNQSTSLLLSKGIEVRPPYIPYQTAVEFVDKQSYLAGWFGEQRPLTATEVMHLYANIQTNKLGEAIVLGFGQVADSKIIRKYMQRGMEIAKKHRGILSKYLSEHDLPVPMSWDHEVDAGTQSPFSDKLMAFHATLLNASGVGNYGMAMSMSHRRDITTTYARLSAEVLKYAEDGLNIMIDEAWLERPPCAVDREALIKRKRN